jgi:hypothetical protein
MIKLVLLELVAVDAIVAVVVMKVGVQQDDPVKTSTSSTAIAASTTGTITPEINTMPASSITISPTTPFIPPSPSEPPAVDPTAPFMTTSPLKSPAPSESPTKLQSNNCTNTSTPTHFKQSLTILSAECKNLAIGSALNDDNGDASGHVRMFVLK